MSVTHMSGPLVVDAGVNSGLSYGRTHFVDTYAPGGDGSDWENAFKTMAQAFANLQSGDTIYLRGLLNENLTTPEAVTDVSIIGAVPKPRHSNLTNAYKKGAASWHTASGVTATPLLTLLSQGWTFRNILFVPPTGSSALYPRATATYSASHMLVQNCRFAAGAIGIQDDEGTGFHVIDGCRFEAQTTASISGTATPFAIPLQWEIRNSFFGYLSASHILVSASSWNIHHNVFGRVASTAKYIDLFAVSSQGLNNMVSWNTLAGVYDTDDYRGGTNDLWLMNAVTVKATTAPDGFTILPPAGP